MLKIRLSRVGKSHTPIYRLVVAEKSRAVKRENIEVLGVYNPTNKDDRLQVKKDRVIYWIEKGAQPSDTARNLLCDFDVLPKKEKVKITYGRDQKKKDKKAQDGKKPEASETETVPEEQAETGEKENPAEQSEEKAAPNVQAEETPAEEPLEQTSSTEATETPEESATNEE